MSKRKKKSGIYFLITFAIVGYAGYYIYKNFFLNASHFKDKNYAFIYVEHKDAIEDVLNKVHAEGCIENFEAFEWLAMKMHLDENINPGKYRITNGMKAREIINLLKYNKQEKIKLTYNSQIRNLEEFVKYTDLKLELTDTELEEILTNEEILKKEFGLNPDNSLGLITPGVYEVSWAISAKDLFSMFNERFKKTWSKIRIGKAQKIGYTVPEILTMASIVQSESGIDSEQRKIAGVYFNRLKKGMPLQADPTLKFANGNYDVQRILEGDKEINSPYNTYRYRGLPPGPIALVSVKAIDATLDYNRHNFVFFCAKPDLNGYSDFSVNYEQHRKFATAYQKSMNKKGINR